MGKLEVGALPDSLSANLYLRSGSAIGSQDCVIAGGSLISLAQGSSFCVTSMFTVSLADPARLSAVVGAPGLIRTWPLMK
jgi:hypothetical protein